MHQVRYIMDFKQWKNEVLAKLAERNIPPSPSDLSLICDWNTNRSAQYAAMAREAEYIASYSHADSARFENAKRCGCFHCTRFFKPEEIDWEDGIPECPFCHMDAVLPESDDYPLTAGMLLELSIKQFSTIPF